MPLLELLAGLYRLRPAREEQYSLWTVFADAETRLNGFCFI